MQIIVTGGAGFIGSHVVDDCLRRGHRVAVIDNLRTGSPENLAPEVELIEMDLGDPGLAATVAKLGASAILHFAAQVDVRISCQDPVFDAGENIIATLRLLEAGLASGMRHFLFASSGGAIYGEAGGPQDEGHPELPINPYGVAKLAVDKYLHAYASQRGLKGASLRFSNVYGPRQGTRGEAGVVAVFCKRLRDGRTPVVNGDGGQTRDFVYAPDLARAVGRVLETGAEGVFNLGTGRETSILDLAAALCRKAGADPAGIRCAAAIPGEQRRSVLDAGKALRVLGWRSETDLDSGLGLTWAWFSRPQARP